MSEPAVLDSELRTWVDMAIAGPSMGRAHVYFVWSAETADRVKIGWSSGPTTDRIRNLQCGSPVKLAVFCHFPGASTLEREMQRRFAAERLHGEWFALQGVFQRFVSVCVARLATRVDRAATREHKRRVEHQATVNYVAALVSGGAVEP